MLPTDNAAPVVIFPEDGHPDLCAAVHDLTGDRRDEIVLFNRPDVVC
jgi:hypothetical protein